MSKNLNQNSWKDPGVCIMLIIIEKIEVGHRDAGLKEIGKSEEKRKDSVHPASQ
ncbi:hypothetical protein ACFLRM_04565 [Acidobacteriota bacterium]